MTQAYTTELTLEQYDLLASLLPPETATGRPRTVNMMSVIQGILYVLVSSCAWRLMPKEYPPSSTVYYYFSKWRNDGSWKRINDHLVEWVRVAEDRDPSPSVASIDSQTVPTAVMVSDSVGFVTGLLMWSCDLMVAKVLFFYQNGGLLNELTVGYTGAVVSMLIMNVCLLPLKLLFILR
jgi:transposase